MSFSDGQCLDGDWLEYIENKNVVKKEESWQESYSSIWGPIDEIQLIASGEQALIEGHRSLGFGSLPVTPPMSSPRMAPMAPMAHPPPMAPSMAPRVAAPLAAPLAAAVVAMGAAMEAPMELSRKETIGNDGDFDCDCLETEGEIHYFIEECQLWRFQSRLEKIRENVNKCDSYNNEKNGKMISKLKSIQHEIGAILNDMNKLEQLSKKEKAKENNSTDVTMTCQKTKSQVDREKDWRKLNGNSREMRGTYQDHKWQPAKSGKGKGKGKGFEKEKAKERHYINNDNNNKNGARLVSDKKKSEKAIMVTKELEYEIEKERMKNGVKPSFGWKMRMKRKIESKYGFDA